MRSSSNPPGAETILSLSSQVNPMKALRYFTSAMSAAFLIGACAGGTDKIVNPAENVASVQIIATPTNPRVGETAILGATPLNTGGVAVLGVACVMVSDSPAILLVTPDGGGWRGVGVTVGTAVVTATCAARANVVTITVRPAQVTLTINKLGAGNGSVFINPPGGTYDMGTTVVITATALTGSTFAGWGGACTAGAAATCSLTLNSSQTTTAMFVLGDPTRVIELSGNLAFGNVTVGQTANATLTIRNSGNSPLTVTGMTAPPGGVYTASWTKGVILPGVSQLVTVFFTPTAAQSYNGTLTVIGDQTSGVNTIAISGTGVGGSPGTTKYDGTYNFFFKNPGPGGVTESHTLARFLIIRSGVVSSSDGTVSGAVDSFGAVRFTSPCTINNSVATWIGNMNASALAGSNFGQGTYTCSLAIGGGTSNSWQATQAP